MGEEREQVSTLIINRVSNGYQVTEVSPLGKPLSTYVCNGDAGLVQKVWLFANRKETNEWDNNDSNEERTSAVNKLLRSLVFTRT